MDLITIYNSCKEQTLFGRYITLSHIEPLLLGNSKTQNLSISGKSVLDKPIYRVELGTGKIKILMWSQMHGNESTCTKAIFDLLNLLTSQDQIAVNLLENFTFCIIPMLNPDGAEKYTRTNANDVDLNRDFIELSQPESQLLQQIYYDFKPDFCYNLHDQRTIFGAGETNNPATVSFLAPSFNENREINQVRTKAMEVIVAMNSELQKHIPNQVGRFDDGFNLNCVGDKFTFLGTPTVLFEAGHYQNDYYREFTRKMIFIALISGLQFLIENDIVVNIIDDYLKIPQNKVLFYDFIYKNVKINYDNKEIITNFAAQFKEELYDNEIHFNAYIVEIGDLKDKIGHFQYNAHKMKYLNNENDFPKVDDKANFCLGKSNKFVNGLKI